MASSKQKQHPHRERLVAVARVIIVTTVFVASHLADVIPALPACHADVHSSDARPTKLQSSPIPMNNRSIEHRGRIIEDVDESLIEPMVHTQPRQMDSISLLRILLASGMLAAAIGFVIYAFARGFRRRNIINLGLFFSSVLVADAASVAVTTKANNHELLGLIRSPSALAVVLLAISLATFTAVRILGRRPDDCSGSSASE